MSTLWLERPGAQRSLDVRSRPHSIARILDAFCAWQDVRAARVIRKYADRAADPDAARACLEAARERITR